MPKNKSKFLILEITSIAILLAIQIVLARWLSIQTPIITIGFSFIPVVIAARYLGIIPGMLVAGLGDLIGAILFPIGAYAPGFTITAAISGLIFGIFLKGDFKKFKAIIGVFISRLVCTVILNTYWLYFYYGMGIVGLLPTRICDAILDGIIQSLLIVFLFTKYDKMFKKHLNFK